MVVFVFTSTQSVEAGPEQDAYRNAAQAAYIQSGLERDVNRLVEIELRKVPEPVKKVVANAFLIAKTIQEQKVVYTWNF